MESPIIGLLCFVLAVLASPFKSKLRLEAENAVRRDLPSNRGRGALCVLGYWGTA
jgi:hypothetical protein